MRTLLARDDRCDFRGEEARQLMPLPLDRFEQRRVCDCDCALVGEGSHQRNFTLREWTHLTAGQADHADKIVLDEDRQAEQRAELIDVGARMSISRVGLDIRDVDRLPTQGDPSGTASRAWPIRMLALVFHDGSGLTEIRAHAQQLTFSEIDEA